MAEFVQHLINGVAAGTIYALVALGYTMVYGVLKLINFAHGDVMMVGCYAGYASARTMGQETSQSFLGVTLVFLIAMAFCATLGFLIERFAYRPLREKPRLVALIVPSTTSESARRTTTPPVAPSQAFDVSVAPAPTVTAP